MRLITRGSLKWWSARNDTRHPLHGLERIRVRGRLVGPVSLHTREAQCEAARITRAGLDLVERDLGDELRLDIDGVSIAFDLDGEQFVRSATPASRP